MKQLYWFVVLVLAGILGWFAASNRQDVTLGLWPFVYDAVVPLYFAILVSLVVGFICGALAAWLRGGRWRREARRRGRRILALERELATTQAQLPRPAEPAAGPPVRGELRG
jgi:uncharacterized integral membrane protein